MVIIDFKSPQFILFFDMNSICCPQELLSLYINFMKNGNFQFIMFFNIMHVKTTAISARIERILFYFDRKKIERDIHKILWPAAMTNPDSNRVCYPDLCCYPDLGCYPDSDSKPVLPHPFQCVVVWTDSYRLSIFVIGCDEPSPGMTPIRPQPL